MHFVQTLVAYFQALDDLHFNLGEFNVLDLEWEGEREESSSHFGQALAQWILEGFYRHGDVAAGDSGGPGSAGLRGLFPPK